MQALLSIELNSKTIPLTEIILKRLNPLICDYHVRKRFLYIQRKLSEGDRVIHIGLTSHLSVWFSFSTQQLTFYYTELSCHLFTSVRCKTLCEVIDTRKAWLEQNNPFSLCLQKSQCMHYLNITEYSVRHSICKVLSSNEENESVCRSRHKVIDRVR